MEEISESERSSLFWMKDANSRGIGLYGPTVRKLGALPEMTRLTSEGFCRLEVGRHRAERNGYWLEQKGREALASLPSLPSGGGE